MGLTPELIGIGFFVGSLIGFTGVGGGLIMAPVLLALNIPATVVVGSDLLYGFVTKMAGVLQHTRQDSVNRRWVTALALGSLPGAGISFVFIHYLNAIYGPVGINFVIKKILGIVLVVAALSIIMGELFSMRPGQRRATVRIADPKGSFVLVACVGMVIGFLVGVTSVGSGSLVAVFLLLCSRLHAREVVGTDIAHAALLSGIAVLDHLYFGSVDSKLVGNLLVGSIPGVLLGSSLTIRVVSRPLKLGTAAVVLLAGLRAAIT